MFSSRRFFDLYFRETLKDFFRYNKMGKSFLLYQNLKANLFGWKGIAQHAKQGSSSITEVNTGGVLSKRCS